MGKKLYLHTQRVNGKTTTRYFQYSGQKRAPQMGEWYLSGAIPEVYEVRFAGLSYPYHIMEEVFPKEKLVVDGVVYKIDPSQQVE